MQKKQHSAMPVPEQFNTLAQNGTTNCKKEAVLIQGNGTELSNGKALKGRAKRKGITQAMMLSLINLCEKKNSPESRKGYRNTFHCFKNGATTIKLFSVVVWNFAYLLLAYTNCKKLVYQKI